MNEREIFEKWFKETFGDRPKGNQQDLLKEIFELKQKLLLLEESVRRIDEWETKHMVSLAAWGERRYLAEKSLK